jgi:nicotinamidase-related amidase
MERRIWDDYITDLDRRVYEKAGFGSSAGFGSRPAILVIDVQYRTVGEDREPILDAMDTYRTAVGERGWTAVDRIRELLEASRPKGVPVLYPVVERKDRFDTGRWKDKIPGMDSEEHRIGQRGTQIVEEVAPEPGDIVISKRYASAFFGTPLMTYLNDLDVDTLVVTGCTTSGCVRATVMDAFSYAFRVIVPEDAVYDRGEASHAINLFDMSQKYADILTTDEVLSFFDGLPASSSEVARERSKA